MKSKRPFEHFTGPTNSFIDLLFTNAYTPEERKKLYQREYLRRGLLACKGCREKTAEFLGMSIRCLRDQLNAWPCLKSEFPIYSGVPQMTFQHLKAEYLKNTPNYWLPSMKTKVKRDLEKIAKNCGHTIIDPFVEEIEDDG